MLDLRAHPEPVKARLLPALAGVIESYRLSQRNVIELVPEETLTAPAVSGALVGRWHMVMAPDLVQRVLNRRVEDYPKSDVARSVLRPAIGESMLVAEGAEWRRQRRMAAPAFQPRHVAGLTPVMAAAAEAAVARIGAGTGRAVDMLAEMTAAAFDVIADVTFSGDRGVDRAAVHRAIEAYGAAAGKMSILDVLGAPDWVPRPARMRDTAEMAAMKDLADACIEERAAGPRKAVPDLLDLMLGAEGLSRRDVRDNLLAFILAGHETTAVTLAWAFYLLGLAPAWQERARAEARAVLGGRVAGAEDVARLPVVRAVIDEALRLYPPAALLSRMAVEPDQLGPAQVLPGDVLTIPVYSIHRHRALWAAPDAFDPGRFLEGPAPARYTYLPFGDGPRVCIGARFALQEAIIILATLLARFRFALVAGRTPTPTLVITLRPEPAVWMEVARA